MENLNALIPYIEVENKIATIRKQDVIADADIAELYGVETKRVNAAVKNNLDKFPKGYFFTLQNTEKQYLVENVDTLSRAGKYEKFLVIIAIE